MTDTYAVAAEYYDLWARSYWNEMAGPLTAALQGSDGANGPVIELGAGTGLGTMRIADAVPGARIVAVEPSRAMRGQLTSKVIARPELHERVTILATDLSGLTWPDPIAGFVALAMLGHLMPDERASLWSELSARLWPGAPAVVHLQPPERPETIPLTRHTVQRLGDLEYEGWNEAEPSGDRLLRWTMTYRVLRDGSVIDEQRWTSEFHTVSFDDVATEAEHAGLRAEQRDAGLVILRHTATS